MGVEIGSEAFGGKDAPSPQACPQCGIKLDVSNGRQERDKISWGQDFGRAGWELDCAQQHVRGAGQSFSIDL